MSNPGSLWVEGENLKFVDSNGNTKSVLAKGYSNGVVFDKLAGQDMGDIIEAIIMLLLQKNIISNVDEFIDVIDAVKTVKKLS